MCSECSRASFLSEIYEEAQPEVPLQREQRSLLEFENGIERTLTVAFQVKSDEGEARGFYAIRDFLRNSRIEAALKFIERDFDSGEFAMRTNAKLAEIESAEHRFGAIDFVQQFGRDRCAVGYARREARGCGPVPRG